MGTLIIQYHDFSDLARALMYGVGGAFLAKILGDFEIRTKHT